MWGKRGALCLTMAIILCGCQGTTNPSKQAVLLYKDSAKTDVKEQFKTTKVIKKDYKETIRESASLYYTETASIQMDTGNAVLDDILVNEGDHIKKGDVVASYTVDASGSELARTKLELEIKRNTYNAGYNQRKNAITNLEKNIKRMEAGKEKDLQVIELGKLKSELKQYQSTEAAVIADEKSYNEQKADLKKTKLRSKVTGIVTKVPDLTFGEPVDVGTEIVALRKTSKFIVAADDTQNGMRYNMKVKVLLGGDRNDIRYTLQGRVMSAGNITGVADSMEEDGESKSVAYIYVSEADKKKYDFENNNIYIDYDIRSVKNAIVVSSSAISSEPEGERKKYFVNLFENGSVHKRFIVKLFGTTDETVVQQGLDVGQEVVLN